MREVVDTHLRVRNADLSQQLDRARPSRPLVDVLVALDRLDDLLTELGLIRELLTSGTELSDIQLFSQLKNLNEIKVALAALPGDAAARMIREVDQLLETVFASSKFGL